MRHLSLILAGFFVAGTGAALAQTSPKLNSISRAWFQREAGAEVFLAGENLAGVKEIVISGAPGVTANVVPVQASSASIESSGAGVTAVAQPDSKRIKVSLASTADAALVSRELRVITDAGVSNPLQIHLGHLPEVESGSNHSRDTAQELALPAAVSGVIGSPAESDFFKFTARKGQLLIFDLYAYRLGGSALDSSLAILDMEGKELARNEDAAGLDSILEFPVPEDGPYLLQLRDFRYQGGGNYNYRLLAGELPHVAAAFPYGGQRGKTVEVTLAGANLDGASKILLQLAEGAATGRQEIRASTARGLSNPFPFDVSDLPQSMEAEPNHPRDKAQLMTIPGAVNGKIGTEKDPDIFRFPAEKDQRIVFEVHAYRFGSPLDALLTLTDTSGTILQRNDDASGSDARIDYRFASAGEYHLVLEDLLGRGGDRFAYRLATAIPQPDFSIAFLPDTPRLRRGGHVPVRVEVSRANGFNGDVRVTASELPPGIHAEPLLISPSGPSAGLLLLSASPGAELGSFPFSIQAAAEVAGQAVQRRGQPLAGDKPVRAAFLTILEEAPFSLLPGTLMAAIEQNQSGAIEVVVERKPGFSGEIKIAPEGFSAGRDPIAKSFEFQPLVLKPGESHGTLSLKTKLDSEIGTRPIILKASADVAGTLVEDYSTKIPVATAEIPFVLSTTLKKLIVTALPADSSSAASEAVFNVKVQRRAGFAGPIELKLEGVPEGVSSTLSDIPAEAGEITVKLVASEKAPAGKDFQITITGTGLHRDRTHRFAPDQVTLTINAPETESPEPKLAGSN